MPPLPGYDNEMGTLIYRRWLQLPDELKAEATFVLDNPDWLRILAAEPVADPRMNKGGG